jgi:hypothetical protein
LWHPLWYISFLFAENCMCFKIFPSWDLQNFETYFINGNTASVQKLQIVKELKYKFFLVVTVLSGIWCSYCSLKKIQEVFLYFLDIKDEDENLIRNVRNFTSQNAITPQKT